MAVPAGRVGLHALVTGSTSGIGLAIAKALAPKVQGLVVHGLDTEERMVKASIECIRKAGNESLRVEFHRANLAKPEEIRGLVEFCREKFGKTPDILINNAGTQHVCPMESFPDDKWDLLIAVNLSAAFHLTKHLVPGMKERGWGRIVNTASCHALVASANKSAYTASKHGIIGLTKAVAVETAPFGITCNAVCPAYVLTDMIIPQIQKLADKEGTTFKEAMEVMLGEKLPIKEPILPDEIGELVAFLCSQPARHITGTAVPIDCGWTAT